MPSPSRLQQDSPLTNLPFEIFDAIAFELSALQPLGPPSILLPLLSTCKQIHDLFSPLNYHGLWARVFRYKFDSGAVLRRAFEPASKHYVDQLMRYCQAMQVLRQADRYFGCGPEVWGPLADIGLEEALETALIMMYEDDGKNSRQLLEWAGLDGLVEGILRSRVYDESIGNNGWPLENRLNTCSVWLMWMLSSEESLKNLTPEERDRLTNILLPFVVVPYRYSTAEAPANYFHLPFSPDNDHHNTISFDLQTTIQTAHGPYPFFPPPNRTHSEIHYSTRPIITLPLISVAAKLLFFALSEVTPIPIPPHLARNREEWLARPANNLTNLSYPNTAVVPAAPTREDMEEVMWGWCARPPLGRAGGLHTRGGKKKKATASSSSSSSYSNAWKWGVGDQSVAMLFDDVIDEYGEVEGIPESNPAVNSRWAGKAPHTIAGKRGEGSRRQRPMKKSEKWDADWWRFRLCGDPWRTRPCVPYGKVFEPGCMNGLWQGRMLLPDQGQIEALLMTPGRPRDFSETSLRLVMQPIFARFREAYAIVDVDHGEELGASGEEGGDGGDNMNNAWFTGMPGSAHFRVREALSREGRGGEEMEEEVEITVVDENGGVKRAVYPCWTRGVVDGEAMGLGNDAIGTGIDNDGDDDLREYERDERRREEQSMMYEHDDMGCDECLARQRAARQLEREKERQLEEKERAERRRERERRDNEEAFAEVGLGYDHILEDDTDDLEDEEQDVDGSHDQSEGFSENNSLHEDEWDPVYAAVIASDGTLHDRLPKAHDRAKLAKGRCDGIKEIFLVGETDKRHGDAFRHYTYYGRVRSWDGLIGILRKPRERRHSTGGEEGNVLFYGYLVGGECFVGNWRITTVEAGVPAWEGAFTMSRRVD